MPDFFPIFTRREADIRGDMDLRANAGRAPGDPNWVDTRPGSDFWLHTQPAVVEIANAYSRMNELVAASILSQSWGTYLDNHAENYGQSRNPATRATGVVTFAGTPGDVVGAGAPVQPTQDDPDVPVPVFNTTQTVTIGSGGTADAPILAAEEGSFGNVAAGAINFAPGLNITSVTNAAATSGGSDEETDDELKVRLLGYFAGAKNGNVADYRRELLTQFPEIGYAKIYPNTPTPGAVLAVVADKDKNPLADVSPYQNYMDPAPQGQGNGWAPINHFVTVQTPSVTNVYVVAVLVFNPGYSLDGDGGTIAQREEIELSVSDYIDSLGPGDDVVYAEVVAAVMYPEGVFDQVHVYIGTGPTPTSTNNIAIGNTVVAALAASDPISLDT